MAEIPHVLVPTIIIFVVLVLGILGFGLWHRHRYERLPDQESRAHGTQRALDEDDTAHGDQVWFSRQIRRGKWRDWCLVVRNRRYELRPGRGSKGEGRFVVAASACSLAYERSQAEADRGVMGAGSCRGFYVCLIGWTRKSHEEILGHGEEVLGTLGDEIWEGNVQAFLKGLADRVLEQRKATDYSWFRDNVTSHHQDVETRLMAGPGVKAGDLRPRSTLQMSSVDAGVRAWAYARA